MPITHDEYVNPPDRIAASEPLGRPASDDYFGFDFPQLLAPPPVGDQGVITDPVTSGGDSATLGDDEREED